MNREGFLAHRNEEEAQAIGEDAPAVDKPISALAMALEMDATIYGLEQAELCYAPQFGSAKDAINFVGMVAADILRGDIPLAHWDETENSFLLANGFRARIVSGGMLSQAMLDADQEPVNRLE